MIWQEDQWERLLLDWKILQPEFPQFQILNIADPTQAFISGRYSQYEFRYSYELSIYLYAGFPFQMPRIFVHDPLPLYLRDGRLLPEDSEDFHTRTRTHSGATQICHDRPDLWNPCTFLLDVLVKGIVWVKAYERHLVTGMTIKEVYETEFKWRVSS